MTKFLEFFNLNEYKIGLSLSTTLLLCFALLLFSYLDINSSLIYIQHNSDLNDTAIYRENYRDLINNLFYIIQIFFVLFLSQTAYYSIRYALLNNRVVDILKSFTWLALMGGISIPLVFLIENLVLYILYNQFVPPMPNLSFNYSIGTVMVFLFIAIGLCIAIDIYKYLNNQNNKGFQIETNKQIANIENHISASLDKIYKNQKEQTDKIIDLINSKI